MYKSRYEGNDSEDIAKLSKEDILEEMDYLASAIAELQAQPTKAKPYNVAQLEKQVNSRVDNLLSRVIKLEEKIPAMQQAFDERLKELERKMSVLDTVHSVTGDHVIELKRMEQRLKDLELRTGHLPIPISRE